MLSACEAPIGLFRKCSAAMEIIICSPHPHSHLAMPHFYPSSFPSSVYFSYTSYWESEGSLAMSGVRCGAWLRACRPLLTAQPRNLSRSGHPSVGPPLKCVEPDLPRLGPPDKELERSSLYCTFFVYIPWHDGTHAERSDKFKAPVSHSCTAGSHACPSSPSTLVSFLIASRSSPSPSTSGARKLRTNQESSRPHRLALHGPSTDLLTHFRTPGSDDRPQPRRRDPTIPLVFSLLASFS
jgi:hypothetical protein